VLKWCLRFKAVFVGLTSVIVFLGLFAWLGFSTLFGFMPDAVRRSRPYVALSHAFPGLGREFMPPLDEGGYLLMPTTMPHASIGEAMDVLRKQDMAINAIPEVESAVGKIGRAESPLDPAPISMIETIISYKPEYAVDKAGRRTFYKFDPGAEDVFRDESGKAVPGPDGEPIPLSGRYFWDQDGKLIEDPDGRPFRLWRPHVKRPDDIWKEIVEASAIPGTTSAPRLQPISARLVMLQSGMRAPMGIKVKGPDLKTIEKVAIDIERLLKSGEVPSVKTEAVVADRIVGKAYLELDWDREALDRYGVHVAKAQKVVEIAIGGMKLTTTVEGRERYPVRVRYMRELRDTIEGLRKILVTAADGTQIPIAQLLERQVNIELDEKAAARHGIDAATVADLIRRELLASGIDEDDLQAGAEIPFPIRVRRRDEFTGKADELRSLEVQTASGNQIPVSDLLELGYPREPWYKRGPMVIKSEDTQLVGYVLFDMKPGCAEVDAVEAAQSYLAGKEEDFRKAYSDAVAEARSESRELTDEEVASLPGLNRRGCTYVFAGNYENQIRSQRTLMVVLPLALFVIFMILFFQFRAASTTLMVFSGILVAWSGGFIMLWLYGQDWFLNFSLFGTSMRDLFQVHPINLSVAVWVGFLALFGIATDDGVVMATYLEQSFRKNPAASVEGIREATLAAGLRRVRPCLMTTATTVLALVPVLTSTGRGSDVMVPMAIPSFGGMAIEALTMLVVPVLYAGLRELRLKRAARAEFAKPQSNN
jgi:Cu(I)/Ag(I) efflux system membrane protein CusA/SilA